MNSPLVTKLAVFLSTGFYLSYLPAGIIGRMSFLPSFGKLQRKKWTGAGLIGTLIGASTYFFLPLNRWASFWMVIVLFGVAVWMSHLAEAHFQVKDDSRIIIDEWVGSWVAFLGLAPVIGWPFIVAFLLFRFFDVWKGPWMRPLQRLPGGWGVVMDDILAGLLARLSVFFLQLIFSH